MLLYLSWCWCWCVLEMWRNCLAAGAGAGGEISGNGTVAGQAARQLSSARPLPRWLKVRAPPPQVHCQDQPEPSSRHQSANQRRETLLPVLGCDGDGGAHTYTPTSTPCHHVETCTWAPPPQHNILQQYNIWFAKFKISITDFFLYRIFFDGLSCTHFILES